MRRIKLTKGKYAIVDDADYAFLKKWSWVVNDSSSRTFYAQRNVWRGKVRTTISMQVALMGSRKGYDVDHINGNGLDNRRKNLRFCTHQENCLNRTRLNKKNTSGFSGVSWNKRLKKWQAYCMKKHLGYFALKREATKARKNFRPTGNSLPEIK